VNCVPPDRVDGLLDVAVPEASVPVMAYPNAGEAYDPATKAWVGPVGSDPADAASRWRRRGASVLGGCCRTGPDTIARMRRALVTS
jgi:homocysteine S-methyltransferase